MHHFITRRHRRECFGRHSRSPAADIMCGCLGRMSFFSRHSAAVPPIPSVAVETECLVKPRRFGRHSPSLPPMSSVAVKTEYLVKHALRREIGNLGPTEAQAQQNLPRMLAEMRRPPLGSHHTIFSICGDRCRVIEVASYFRLMDRRETAARLE